MKNYTITVNGNTYQVQVEEGEASSVSSPVTPLAKPAQAAPKAEVKASTGAAGSIKVESPMAGKILAVKANVGQSVKRGEVLLVLEAMKMETWQSQRDLNHYYLFQLRLVCCWLIFIQTLCLHQKIQKTVWVDCYTISIFSMSGVFCHH